MGLTQIKEFPAPEQEMDYIVGKIRELEAEGVDQKNICIVARTHKSSLYSTGYEGTVCLTP